MERLTVIGRVFFAIALCGLGIEHFIFQSFVTGRAPDCSVMIQACLTWTYLAGVLFIVVSVATITGTKARPALIFAAVLIFLWAFLRHIPVVVASSFLSGDWTSAGKALTLIGGSLALSSTFPKAGTVRNTILFRFVNLENEFIITGRVCLGIFLIITGLQHFMFIVFVASLIPSWFPGDPVFWTRFAGVALIASGVGLLIPKTARLAALLSGVMVFLWFWIIHIPRTLSSVSDGIAVFEALGVSGIAFVLVGSSRKDQQQ